MILVAGDSMLDRYWEGRVDRISPEAPVPVLQVLKESSRPGGAANVALNLAVLGSQVRLVTPMGDDDAGQELAKLLIGVEVQKVKTPFTPQKIRMVATRQQLLRTDFEAPLPAIRILPDDCKAMILSDYAKGSLAHAKDLIRDARCRVYVDPKGDFSRYRGAYLLKPNEAETREVVGQWSNEAEFLGKCEALREALELECLLVTRGENGMTLFDGGIFHVPAHTREVYDVSGAGDTVIAALAHFSERPIREAVTLANKAAGIVVGKFGTATVSPDELH